MHDLTVTGSVITTGKDAAGIVGKAKTKTTIVNCLNRADVTAASSAAGVVGMADGMVSKAAAAKNAPAITGCGNTGTITATDEAGCAQQPYLPAREGDPAPAAMEPFNVQDE